MVTVLPGLYRSIYSAWFTRFRCGKVAGFNSSKEILVCFGAFSEPEKTVKRRLGMLASHDWILSPGQNTHFSRVKDLVFLVPARPLQCYDHGTEVYLALNLHLLLQLQGHNIADMRPNDRRPMSIHIVRPHVSINILFMMNE